jgi:hypothetical protein
VDGVLVVVAAHQTPRALLETALDVVDPTKLIGIVFNGFDNLGNRGHGRHYARYYPSSVGRENRGGLGSIVQKAGSIFRRRGAAAVRSRRSRDRSR